MTTQKQFIVRCNQNSATTLSRGQFVNRFERPITTLEPGDTIALHSASIDSLIEKPTDNVVLSDDVDIVFEFTPGLQHFQNDSSQTIMRNAGVNYQSPTTTADFLSNVPNGGFAYPVSNTLTEADGNNGPITVVKVMKKYVKTIRISKGTYTKPEIIELMNDRINDYNDNFEVTKNKFKDSSFLHTTENNANDLTLAVDAATKTAVLQNASTHGGEFWHFQQGDWYQYNAYTDTIDPGRAYYFYRRFNALDEFGNATQEVLEPIFYGASFCQFSMDDNKVQFYCHTPCYDTSTLTSLDSTANSVVGFQLYTSSPLLKTYSTSTDTVSLISSTGAAPELDTIIVPKCMPVNRYGAVLFHSIKAVNARTRQSSDLFKQLGVDMTSHCITTDFKTYQINFDDVGINVRFIVEEPVSIEDGIYTSSEMGSIDYMVPKIGSSISNPFYYTKTEGSSNVEVKTDRAEFSDTEPTNGRTYSRFNDDTGTALSVLVPSGNNVNLDDFNLKFKQVSSGAKAIQIDQTSTTNEYSSSFDISVDLYNSSFISNNGYGKSTQFVFSGLTGNYHSEDTFTSVSGSKMLQFTYDGPKMDLSSVQIAILDSFTDDTPEFLGNKNIFTFVIKKADFRFE